MNHLKLYSDSLYVSCVNEAARYHTAKWPNRTYMYVFQHRSKKAETPLWMGKLQKIQSNLFSYARLCSH